MRQRYLRPKFRNQGCSVITATRLTWAGVGVLRQLIAVMAGTVVAIICINARIKTIIIHWHT